MEQETTPQMQEEQPWPDCDWGYYSWGIPMTMPMCWGNMPGRKTGVVKKGGKASPAWPNIRRDPGGDVYVKSDRATKANEGSIAKQMPLLSEFPGYGEWKKEAEDGQGRCITPP